MASAIPLAACAFAFSLGPSPEKNLKLFCTTPGTDERAVDHLRKAGDKVVPLVIGEVGKKDMPRRRTAMQFLASSRQRTALPTLELILRDETEEQAVRAEALRAINLIDPTRGQEHAQLLEWRSDSLGTVAKALREAVPPAYEFHDSSASRRD